MPTVGRSSGSGVEPSDRRTSRRRDDRSTARKGLGALGFSLDELPRTELAVKAYKRAVADAEPVGAFVNDNHVVAYGFNFVAEDRDQARLSFLAGASHY